MKVPFPNYYASDDVMRFSH